MAFKVEIMCINKSPRMAAHERIANVGGLNNDGTPWKLQLDQAIAGIEQGKWHFVVRNGTGLLSHEVDVIIAKSAAGNKYLKTEADGEQPNNLLSLPECP